LPERSNAAGAVGNRPATSFAIVVAGRLGDARRHQHGGGLGVYELVMEQVDPATMAAG